MSRPKLHSECDAGRGPAYLNFAGSGDSSSSFPSNTSKCLTSHERLVDIKGEKKEKQKQG